MATLTLNNIVIKKTSATFIAPKKKEYIINNQRKGDVVDPESFFKKPGAEKKAVVLTSNQKMKKTLNWLCKNFPKAFNRVKPKPLMVGIHEVVLAEVKIAQPHIKSQLIKKALWFYTSSIKYKQSIVNSSKRIDIKGNPVGEVLDGDKEHAIAAIKVAEERMGKKVDA